jgi:hypothetical protein
MRLLRTILLAAALAGCAQLSAEAPLFAVADQVGPPPLSEGVWIAIGEECGEHNARRSGRFPKDCAPIEISRLPDGAWSARYRVDLATGLTREERAEAEAQAARVMHLFIVPAVERRTPEAHAPLYVAEITSSAPEDKVAYAVLAPLGDLPATSMLVIPGIDCADALRDGPIDGVTEQYTERVDETGVTHQDLSGCLAASQAAVRQAARRALIENLATLPEQRYVYVGRR